MNRQVKQLNVAIKSLKRIVSNGYGSDELKVALRKLEFDNMMINNGNYYHLESYGMVEDDKNKKQDIMYCGYSLDSVKELFEKIYEGE